VRQSIDLAVAELKESSRRALMSSIYVIAALLLLIVAGLLFVISLAFVLAALGVPTWLAFMLDALLFVVVAGVLLLLAKKNASKIKAPTAAADAAEKYINEITETITKFNQQP
jgi:membrane protein implicated in regulation of membrane protease activity